MVSFKSTITALALTLTSSNFCRIAIAFNTGIQSAYPSLIHKKTLAKTTALRSTISPALEAPPIPQSDPNHALIQIANKYLYTQSGFYSSYDASALSDEFVFRGPYIGPLNKEDYLNTMDTFGIWKAIPDINPNAFGFTIDPKDENRVWFMVRNTGTFTGEPGLGFGKNLFYPPNNKPLIGCPETFSITFDKDKKVKHLTVGYVADRFQGNTEGQGAAVGIFRAIGIPFPSPGPVLTFAQWFATEVVNTGASSYSTKDVPSWWTSQEKASEGY